MVIAEGTNSVSIRFYQKINVKLRWARKTPEFMGPSPCPSGETGPGHDLHAAGGESWQQGVGLLGSHGLFMASF